MTKKQKAGILVLFGVVMWSIGFQMNGSLGFAMSLCGGFMVGWNIVYYITYN